MPRFSTFRFVFLSVLLLLQPVSFAQQATESALPSISTTYEISNLDVLRIRLFVADELQFDKELRVSQDGAVSLPYLDRFEIAGMTVDEARRQLFELYNRDYYVNPQIEIIVLSYVERTVTVIGKVNRQGPVPLPGERPMYLLEAIAMAGGWSNDRLADRTNVTITRDIGNGEKSVIKVDARNITARDYELKEGDLINVPERIW